MITLVLLVVAIGLIVFGEIRWRQKYVLQPAPVGASVSATAVNSTPPPAKTPPLSPAEMKQLSVIELLQDAARRGGKPTISLIGCGVTKGDGASSSSTSWSGLLNSHLKGLPELSGINYQNNALPLLTTSKILTSGVLATVVGQKPTVVLIETSLLNDYAQSIPLDKTLANLDAVMKELKKGLPEARIILQSSNPRERDVVNLVGLRYQQYVERVKQYAASQSWEHIDVYGDFERQRLAEGLTLHQVLAEEVLPTDKGNNYWFQTLKSYFTKGKLGS